MVLTMEKFYSHDLSKSKTASDTTRKNYGMQKADTFRAFCFLRHYAHKLPRRGTYWHCDMAALYSEAKVTLLKV